MKSKRILFYVHFNKYNNVDDYVVYQLEKMRPIFDTVILISNSQVSADDKKKFDGLYDRFLQRKNEGYDFAAWRDGMNMVGWDEVEAYDELTIMNDTCFGPIYDFEPIYDKMQSKKVDFWGMTLNLSLKNLVADSKGKSIVTPIHIQSYYITFNKNVISSNVFKKFWTGVETLSDVGDVIIKYEVALTELLANHGFTYDAYYNAVKDWKRDTVSRGEADVSAVSAGDMKKYNPGYTCTRPLWLLKKVDKYPFIKTKAILMASSQIGDMKEYIEANAQYPTQLLDIYIGSRYSDIMKAKDQQITNILNSRSYRLGLAASGVYRRVIRK